MHILPAAAANSGFDKVRARVALAGGHDGRAQRVSRRSRADTTAPYASQKASHTH